MSVVLPEISIRINDQRQTFAAPITLVDALRKLGWAERKGIAVAIDDHVVPRSRWSERVLAEGEKLLVIQATQGG